MAYTIDSATMQHLIETGKKALKGDSNDAEHDALYEIVLILETFEPERKRKSKRSDAKSP
jgi:hypothetical protein